jgi:hypothetical protein
MKKLNRGEAPLCSCGCGKQVNWKDGRWNRFINHHWGKGRIVSKRTKQRLSKANKKYTSNEKILTQELLKKLLHYNPSTGLFRWKLPFGKQKINGIAGGKNSQGYTIISINSKLYRAARLAFLYMEGYFPEYHVDHINRIRDDNRWENLRHITQQCNNRNTSKRSDNTSGITGVTWNKLSKKWVSQISTNGKNKYLGIFGTLKEAAKIRWEAEVKYDYPNCNTTSSAYQFLQENK